MITPGTLILPYKSKKARPGSGGGQIWYEKRTPPPEEGSGVVVRGVRVVGGVSRCGKWLARVPDFGECWQSEETMFPVFDWNQNQNLDEEDQAFAHSFFLVNCQNPGNGPPPWDWSWTFDSTSFPVMQYEPPPGEFWTHTSTNLQLGRIDPQYPSPPYGLPICPLFVPNPLPSGNNACQWRLRIKGQTFINGYGDGWHAFWVSQGHPEIYGAGGYVQVGISYGQFPYVKWYFSGISIDPEVPNSYPPISFDDTFDLAGWPWYVNPAQNENMLPPFNEVPLYLVIESGLSGGDNAAACTLMYLSTSLRIDFMIIGDPASVAAYPGQP